MNQLKAHWCYMDNFGDALNPYILSKLTGKNVVYCNYTRPEIFKEIMHMLKSLVRLRKYDFRRMSIPVRNESVILCVGSILSRALPNYQIWGAGFMNENETTSPGDIYAVRGEYSARKLANSGFKFCKTYGDPALLLPLIYPKMPSNEIDVGIIPHMKEYSYFATKYPDRQVINLATKEIESTIDLICKCRLVISTSLHGLIVAHAYGIPAILAKHGDIDTDGFKFNDYFSSVGINPYNGFSDIDHVLMDCDVFFQRHSDRILPGKNIESIQKSLLKCAPFELKDAFRDLIGDVK